MAREWTDRQRHTRERNRLEGRRTCITCRWFSWELPDEGQREAASQGWCSHPRDSLREPHVDYLNNSCLGHEWADDLVALCGDHLHRVERERVKEERSE